MSDWRDVADDKPRRCLSHPLPKSRHDSALRREFYEVHRDQRMFDREQTAPVKVTKEYLQEDWTLKHPNGRFSTWRLGMSAFVLRGIVYVLLRCDYEMGERRTQDRLHWMRERGWTKSMWVRDRKRRPLP